MRRLRTIIKNEWSLNWPCLDTFKEKLSLLENNFAEEFLLKLFCLEKRQEVFSLTKRDFRLAVHWTVFNNLSELVFKKKSL